MRLDVLAGTLTRPRVGLQGAVFQFTRHKRFCQSSKAFEPALVPTQLPMSGGGGAFSTGEERPSRDSGHSPHSGPTLGISVDSWRETCKFTAVYFVFFVYEC